MDTAFVVDDPIMKSIKLHAPIELKEVPSCLFQIPPSLFF